MGLKMSELTPQEIQIKIDHLAAEIAEMEAASEVQWQKLFCIAEYLEKSKQDQNYWLGRKHFRERINAFNRELTDE